MCDISSDAELHGLQSLCFAFWISSWLYIILCRKYDFDHSWIQKYSIWVFSIPSEDRVETWHTQFCRAHRTLSTRAWMDPVDQFLWRRILWNSMRGILETASVVAARPRVSSIRARFGTKLDAPFDAELNGLQSDARVWVEAPSLSEIWSKYWRMDDIGNDYQRAYFGSFDPISRCIRNLMYPVL